MTKLNLNVSSLHKDSVVQVVTTLTSMGISCVTTSLDDNETNIDITIPAVLSKDTILTLGTVIGQIQVQTISKQFLNSLQKALTR